MPVSVALKVKVVPELLEKALTHRSYAHEHAEASDNERLEFLGDAVIGLACGEYLFRNNPDSSEGDLALQRANLVSTTALAARAREIGLGDHLRLGNGEEKSGGRDRDSNLANAYEALVGAIFLSAGWEEAKRFFVAPLDRIGAKDRKDNKSRLQELLQAQSGQTPTYELTASLGPDHAKTFVVAVHHQGEKLGSGRGKSKKEAEQAAAEMALESLQCDAHQF